MGNQMKIAALAIVCITVLEAVALSVGINGIVLATAIAAIAGLGGFNIAKYLYKRNG